MESLKNHVTLVGNIGANAEITNFENGSKVVRFNLAIDELTGKQGNEYKQTKWQRVFAWGNMAQYIEKYATKGKKVAVHGRLVNRTFLDKSGQKKQVTEVELHHIIGL